MSITIMIRLKIKNLKLVFTNIKIINNIFTIISGIYKNNDNCKKFIIIL